MCEMEEGTFEGIDWLDTLSASDVNQTRIEGGTGSHSPFLRKDIEVEKYSRRPHK